VTFPITITGPVTFNAGPTLDQITAAVTAALTPAKEEIMTDFHAELDAAIAAIQAADAAELADLTRELADFAAKAAPSLSADEQAQLAAILQSAQDRDAAIVAADPAPAAAAADPSAPAAA
jgi:hypothetical protein